MSSVALVHACVSFLSANIVDATKLLINDGQPTDETVRICREPRCLKPHWLWRSEHVRHTHHGRVLWPSVNVMICHDDMSSRYETTLTYRSAHFLSVIRGKSSLTSVEPDRAHGTEVDMFHLL